MNEQQRRPHAIQVNQIEHINKTAPISEKDYECLEEIKQVLERYGATTRFGVALLHNHFPMGEDEILLETCDESTRTLVAKPVKKSEIPEHCCVIKTIWAFDENTPRSCVRGCPTCSDGRHYGHSDHY